MTKTVTTAKHTHVRGLYAITPDMADTKRLCELVEASLQGGASMIQYRNKTANPALRTSQAQALLKLCRKYNAPLIINDHIELCLTLDADGVHLGAEDIDAHHNMARVRRQLGTNKILGISCYNRFELAQQAKQQGADYAAFGACFASTTKPAAVNASLQLISRAHNDLGLPIVAIGGITLDNAPLAIGAGASSIAVINALFRTENIQQTAQRFTQLFDNHYDKSANLPKSATV